LGNQIRASFYLIRTARFRYITRVPFVTSRTLLVSAKQSSGKDPRISSLSSKKAPFFDWIRPKKSAVLNPSKKGVFF